MLFLVELWSNGQELSGIVAGTVGGGDEMSTPEPVSENAKRDALVNSSYSFCWESENDRVEHESGNWLIDKNEVVRWEMYLYVQSLTFVLMKEWEDTP